MESFYWAWRMSGFTLTVTGAWETDDPLWWERVYQFHNLYEWLLEDERDSAPKDNAGNIIRGKRFKPMTLDDEPSAPGLSLADL